MRLTFWTILLFSIWMILTNNIQVANLLTGVIISFSISILYLKLFESKEKFIFINPFWIFVYLLVLGKNLLLSNIRVAKKVLSPDMKLSPAIVAVKTELKSDWKKLLLANSITLTPGTLTLDIIDNTLYIHTLECIDVSNKEKITQEFEKIIAKI